MHIPSSEHVENMHVVYTIDNKTVRLEISMFYICSLQSNTVKKESKWFEI
jgi:hypothetical protein